ncbi:MAG: hypothetical protein ABIO79_05970 [Ferruginibacter sp.]
MFYLVFSILFVVWLFAFLSFLIMKRKKKKFLQKLSSGWGQQNFEPRNFELIEAYTKLNPSIPFHQLSAQTLGDIDFYEIFCFLDRTISKPGQQFFFDKLTRPTDNLDKLKEFDKQVNFFLENKAVREDARFLLSQLNKNDAYYISALLKDKLLEKPKWANLFIADTLLVIAMLVSSPWYPVLLIWLLLPFAINLFLHYRNKKNTYKFSMSFVQLNLLLKVSKTFLKKEIPFEKTNVAKSVSGLKEFQRKFRLLNFGDYGDNEMAQAFFMVFELLKAFFLIEIHSFFSVLKTLHNKRADIDMVMKYIGSIDAAISTASLRSGVNKFTVPVFTERKKGLQAKNLYHPLIEECITNSLTIKDKSILITGSNMSGKSTFIRTLAINSILAQTIYTCFATEFVTPFVKVFSSIRMDDSLSDAKSYYFEEVNVISGLITQSTNSFQNLFILDEVFKGTNTIERVAAAKAILSYLNKNDNIVFVSTHDIELAVLLKTEYDLYHFVEDIENDNLIFDHKLKQGQLTSRNAIKILELSNYPAEITAEARSIANKH